jgi:uncharacterized protein YcfL
MLRRILAALLSLTICASHAQIYRWVDSQGVVNYSDMPHAGAQAVKDSDIQSYSTPLPSSSSTEPAIEKQGDTKKSQHDYKKVVIIEPADQITIRNTQGYVLVKAEIQPKLFVGDNAQLIFDGTAQGSPQNTLSFELNGVNRGSHTIAIQVINSDGDVLKTSPAITIFMQQPRINMGKTRPSL